MLDNIYFLLVYLFVCVCRHDYGEEKRRQRDEYDAKEREEAVKKARERRMNEYRVRNSSEVYVPLVVLVM